MVVVFLMIMNDALGDGDDDNGDDGDGGCCVSVCEHISKCVCVSVWLMLIHSHFGPTLVTFHCRESHSSQAEQVPELAKEKNTKQGVQKNTKPEVEQDTISEVKFKQDTEWDVEWDIKVQRSIFASAAHCSKFDSVVV